MTTDFLQASRRHFHDAEKLCDDGRVANADHLYGLSAECSLKMIMVALGMATTKTGAPRDRGHKVHMPEQWAAFQSFAQGRLASRYLEPLDHVNPFADWKVDQRYWRDSGVTVAATQKHRDAARQCRTSLGRLVLDGVLS